MKKNTPEDIVNQIQEACKLLGWDIALNESGEGVSGLIIGQYEYVSGVISQLEDFDEYSMYGLDPDKNSDIH